MISKNINISIDVIIHHIPKKMNRVITNIGITNALRSFTFYKLSILLKNFVSIRKLSYNINKKKDAPILLSVQFRINFQVFSYAILCILRH